MQGVSGAEATTAELLVHRILLTKVVHTVTTALASAEGIEAAKRELHAMVVADLDRARFLGSSPEQSEAMRNHANAVLDKIIVGEPLSPTEGA